MADLESYFLHIPYGSGERYHTFNYSRKILVSSALYVSQVSYAQPQGIGPSNSLRVIPKQIQEILWRVSQVNLLLKETKLGWELNINPDNYDGTERNNFSYFLGMIQPAILRNQYGLNAIAHMDSFLKLLNPTVAINFKRPDLVSYQGLSISSKTLVRGVIECKGTMGGYSRSMIKEAFQQLNKDTYSGNKPISSYHMKGKRNFPAVKVAHFPTPWESILSRNNSSNIKIASLAYVEKNIWKNCSVDPEILGLEGGFNMTDDTFQLSVNLVAALNVYSYFLSIPDCSAETLDLNGRTYRIGLLKEAAVILCLPQRLFELLQELNDSPDGLPSLENKNDNRTLTEYAVGSELKNELLSAPPAELLIDSEWISERMGTASECKDQFSVASEFWNGPGLIYVFNEGVTE